MASVISDFWAVSTLVTEGFLSGGGVDDRCCSYYSVPWKLIIEIVLSVCITAVVTYQIAARVIADRIEHDSRTRIRESILAIYEDVREALERALLATGDAKASEAQALHRQVSDHLGPLMRFMGPVSAAAKALDDVAKGEVAQELLCTGFNCDKRNGPAGGHPPEPPTPQPHPQPNGPVASASAAGGGAAASAVAAGGQTIIITGGGAAGGHGHGHGSGTDAPTRRLTCDCGKGKLGDYVAPPRPTLTRRMTDKEKSHAARAAIEQFAGVWQKDAIVRQLHEILTALTTATPKKKDRLAIEAETVHLYGNRVIDHTRKNDRDH